MSRAICGLCGTDWPEDGGPSCECRAAAARVVEMKSSSSLERFAAVLRVMKGISPTLAADLATGRTQIGEA